MPAFIDLTGNRFGRLIAVSRAKSGSDGARWNCLCDCGRECVVRASKLRSGHTRSCGCLFRDGLSTQNKTHGFKSKSSTPQQRSTYRCWEMMWNRCTSENRKDAANYFHRGIRVCDRWKSFENFLSDMGLRPSSKHSIERKDNSRGYEPGNCCWATKKEQGRNKRNNRLLEFRGETKCVAEWCEILGLPEPMVRLRLDRYGWSVERALTTPSMYRKGRPAILAEH
jgi:hypothetical protein